MRVKGHTLRIQGKPGWIYSQPLVAVCSCGQKSPPLPSINERKLWHRDHRSLVLYLDEVNGIKS